MRSWSLLCVLTLGCTSDGAHPGWTATDSAGVRLVEIIPSPDALPEYATIGDADLTIGSLDGAPEYSFGGIGDVRSLPGRGVLVTDVQDQSLRLFDEQGTHLVSVGARGDGPGEFRLLSIAGVEPDTVWIWDPIHQRVTVLSLHGDGEGEVEGAVESVVTFDHDAAARPYEMIRLDDGSYVARSRFRELDALDPAFAELRVWTDSMVLRHLDAAGADLDTIAVTSAEEVLREIWPSDDGEGRPVGALRPFGARTHWAVDHRARTVTVEGTTGAWTLRDARGTTVLHVGFAAPLSPLSTSEVDRMRRDRLAEVDGFPEMQTLVDRVFADDVLPEFVPRVSAVKIDALGAVWIAEFAALPGEAVDWMVFSPEGEPLGRVSLPERFEAHEFGADYVLGVQRDELDVEYVRRHALLRPH